jgi:hypothetical protein
MKLLKGEFGMGKIFAFFGSILVLVLLVLPANFVFAHDGDDCPCIDLVGAERNKAIANVLKSTEFKEVKKEKKREGYKFTGANQIMAVKMPGPDGIIYTMVAVPFVHENGDVLFSVFTDGIYMGDGPPMEH